MLRRLLPLIKICGPDDEVAVNAVVRTSEFFHPIGI